MTLPESLCDQRYVVTAFQSLFCGEQSSLYWLDAQCLEEFSRCQTYENFLRMISAGRCAHVLPPLVIDRHLLEGMVQRGKISQVRAGHAHLLSILHRRNLHQAICVLKFQRAQQHSIQHTEY